MTDDKLSRVINIPVQSVKLLCYIEYFHNQSHCTSLISLHKLQGPDWYRKQYRICFLKKHLFIMCCLMSSNYQRTRGEGYHINSDQCLTSDRGMQKAISRLRPFPHAWYAIAHLDSDVSIVRRSLFQTVAADKLAVLRYFGGRGHESQQELLYARDWHWTSICGRFSDTNVLRLQYNGAVRVWGRACWQ